MEKKVENEKCQFSKTRQYTLNQSSENQCFKLLSHLTLTKCVNWDGNRLTYGLDSDGYVKGARRVR